MPSPLAHTAVGLHLLRLLPEHPDASPGARALAVTCLSLLPDADAIAGLAGDDFAAYHNQASHSLLGVLLAGTATALISRRRLAASPGRGALLGSAAYAVHLLLDLASTRRGLLLLWPLSRRRFAAPVKLFYGLRWNAGLCSIHHWRTLYSEALFALLLWGLPRLWALGRTRP